MKLRKLILDAVLPFLLACSVSAQSRPELIKSASSIKSRSQVEEWMTYYYQHPRPDLMVSALHFMGKDGWFKKEDARPPIAAFLAKVYAANPDRLDTWANDIRKDSEEEKSSVAFALWMANDENCRRVLKEIASAGSESYQEKLNALFGNQPPDLLRDEINSPQFLDALWGSFFATGDERYVQRLISALPMLSDKDDTTQVLIGGAAQWSLAANAFQHPKVMQICKAALEKLPDDQKAAVRKIIESASNRKK